MNKHSRCGSYSDITVQSHQLLLSSPSQHPLVFSVMVTMSPWCVHILHYLKNQSTYKLMSPGGEMVQQYAL